MENVSSVSAAGTAALTCAGGNPLEGFLAKADTDSALEALIFQDINHQAQIGKQGVKLHSRRAAEARQKRFEALQRLQAASKKSGFWGKLTGVLKGIFRAASAALLIFCPAAAAGVALAGAVVCGATSIVKAQYDSTAARAKADQIEEGARMEHARLEQQENRDFLQQAVDLEKNMVQQLRKAIDLQYQAPRL
jgi:hypothetical protein